MTWPMALALFATLASGAWLVQSRDALRIAIGLMLMGNAVNLVLMASGGRADSAPPVVPAGQTVLQQGMHGALPQALTLTAIVIGFALLCVSMVLVRRLVLLLRRNDLTRLDAAEPAAPSAGYLPTLEARPLEPFDEEDARA